MRAFSLGSYNYCYEENLFLGQKMFCSTSLLFSVQIFCACYIFCFIRKQEESTKAPKKRQQIRDASGQTLFWT